MTVEERHNKIGRRSSDHLLYWAPILIGLAIAGGGQWLQAARTIVEIQGQIAESEIRLSGEMKLLEYRLEQVEKRSAP
jgi:hypothetical protein